MNYIEYVFLKKIGRFKSIILAAIVLPSILLCPSVAQATDSSRLSMSFLMELNHDWSANHHAIPMGVPLDYDWVNRPRMGVGNKPGGFTTFIGWGHVFWSDDSVSDSRDIIVRNFHTFVCSGEERQWSYIDSKGIDGAEFRADFKGNEAKSPVKFIPSGDGALVRIGPGSAFHFWPRNGRNRLPEGPLCGFLVLLEARLVDVPLSSVKAGGYLIGLGVDYWADMSSPWDNFKTNKGVGLGRLKYVESEWSWYGMSTASDEDLQRLYLNEAIFGFIK